MEGRTALWDCLSFNSQPPPRGTPIGMARRMPDGPAHGLPPACGTP
eukprot:COSAG01_NODE_4773_length_4753_cov_3.688440_1_plen_45_part_10